MDLRNVFARQKSAIINLPDAHAILRLAKSDWLSIAFRKVIIVSSTCKGRVFALSLFSSSLTTYFTLDTYRLFFILYKSTDNNSLNIFQQYFGFLFFGENIENLTWSLSFKLFIILLPLFEIHTELVFDPRVSVRALLARVEIPLLPELPGEEFADPGQVAGLVLDGDGLVTTLPGLEVIHLSLGRRLSHPLDGLIVVHDPHVLPGDHVVQETSGKERRKKIQNWK